MFSRSLVFMVACGTITAHLYSDNQEKMFVNPLARTLFDKAIAGEIGEVGLVEFDDNNEIKTSITVASTEPFDVGLCGIQIAGMVAFTGPLAYTAGVTKDPKALFMSLVASMALTMVHDVLQSKRRFTKMTLSSRENKILEIEALLDEQKHVSVRELIRNLFLTAALHVGIGLRGLMKTNADVTKAVIKS